MGPAGCTPQRMALRGRGRPAGRRRVGGRNRLRDMPDVRQREDPLRPHHGTPGSGRELRRRVRLRRENEWRLRGRGAETA
ncbi:MAG TPA: hypothetical protein ACQGQH_05895 [Xylella sp.]